MTPKPKSGRCGSATVQSQGGGRLIGILQTGRAPEALIPRFGDYPDMFADLLAGHGFSFRTWAVMDGSFPASVTQADGWLITGSRHGVYEDLAFIPVLEQFILDVRDAGVPLVGICFGHQIIAQALGGTVAKFPGGWSVGPTQYDLDGDSVVLNAWHQDQVIALPEGAKVTATARHCAIAGCAYGDRIVSFQAHPEFSDAFLAALGAERGRGVVPQALLDAIGPRAAGLSGSEAIAGQIAHVFRARVQGCDAEGVSARAL